ncbi:MAG: alanine racemase [Betaproteobacteria bacterium]
MTRPIRAEFSASALLHNYNFAKRLAPQSKVFAVVKANAYGHGVERVMRALPEADAFATLELDSAIGLRKLGVEQPILMLEGLFEKDEIPYYCQHQLMMSVHNDLQMEMLTAQKPSIPLSVFLKMNSGMNRLGFTPQRYGAEVHKAQDMQTKGLIADLVLMTHFAGADGPEGIEAALKLFLDTIYAAKASTLPRSVANSAATLRFPEAHFNYVRPGIMLYGSSPFSDHSAAALGLKPVMTLRSEIIGEQTLQAGDRVGYGGTFTAKRRMRIGIVACGYADGYPRHAPGHYDQGTPILVGGKRTRTVGRVSMDMLVADITDMPHVHIGAPVTLWGEGLSADEVAHASGTVAYELFCAVTSRVKMVDVD